MSMSQFNADELNIVDAELAVRTRGFADIHIAAAVEGSDNSEKAAAISGDSLMRWLACMECRKSRDCLCNSTSLQSEFVANIDVVESGS